MADVLHYTCPFCNHDATLQDHDYVSGSKHLKIRNPADGHKHLRWYYVVCPNSECMKFTLRVGLSELSQDENYDWNVGDFIKKWDLVPSSLAKIFPDYIPKVILDDYNEACLIVDLSPKASATLSRRCLQGILRDFWKVKTGSLAKEIDQVEDQMDPLTWEAIDAIRKVGNIGAHMEKDINLIVDVDPTEAAMLIELIETLLADWYVAKEKRKKRLEGIKKMSDKKTEARKAKPKPPSTVDSP